MSKPPTETADLNPANTLGLDYRAEAAKLPYTGPIIDAHTHVGTPRAAELFFEVAALFGVESTWTMTGIDSARVLHEQFADRIHFICVADYLKREEPGTFTTRWLDEIESFRAIGSEVIKFWSAPRGIDLLDEVRKVEPDADTLRLSSPVYQAGMQRAYELGYRVFMVHIADPDTWFATAYADAARYGTKRDQYPPLEDALDRYPDVTWIGAHMGGSPEDLDWLHDFLGRHPNFVVDTSACKWQVRELSKHPRRFAQFCEANPCRVLFGTDIVANEQRDMLDFDLYASRFWALRTLIETDYDGLSPIVDPDLHKVDPSLPEDSTAHLSGANLGKNTLRSIYCDAAKSVLDSGKIR